VSQSLSRSQGLSDRTLAATAQPHSHQSRPSCLLSKCVERKILKQVEDGSVRLSDSHGGFKATRSRYDLILLLRCAQDHYHKRGQSPQGRTNRKVLAAFLDTKKKAYGSVPHAKITERLRDAGVKEETVRTVADLLPHRTTTVYGSTVNTGRGVPQGDPLSPLLFIVMMQPMSEMLASLDPGRRSSTTGRPHRQGFTLRRWYLTTC